MKHQQTDPLACLAPRRFLERISSPSEAEDFLPPLEIFEPAPWQTECFAAAGIVLLEDSTLGAPSR